MAKSFRSRLMAGWMKFGRALGDFQARILLILVFTFVVLPIGLIWKLIGKDVMGKRFEASKKSYFNNSSVLKPEHWERMF